MYGGEGGREGERGGERGRAEGEVRGRRENELSCSEHLLHVHVHVYSIHKTCLCPFSGKTYYSNMTFSFPATTHTPLYKPKVHIDKHIADMHI